MLAGASERFLILKFVEITEGVWQKIMESTYKFHKIDQTVSVLPSLAAVTTQRRDLDVLGHVEFMQRLGEQVHRVVDQGRLSLEIRCECFK